MILNKQEMIDRILHEISMRASRHKRATDAKTYLISDLQYIENKTEKLKNVIASDKTEYFV